MTTMFTFTASGYPRPTHPTLRGRLERLIAPGYGYCFRCGRPWNRADEHATPYEEQRACFPLCEWCWSTLTPMERVPYYDALVNNWITQTPNEAVEYERKRTAIFRAVLDGA